MAVPGVINLPAAIIYLILPSLIYSFIFKSPRIVLDPIVLIAAEALLPVFARRILRMAWIIVCGSVLLMDWNIYSESYLFYGSMLGRIVLTPHGVTILSAMAVMTAFLALPSRLIKPNRQVFGVSILVYCALVWWRACPGPGRTCRGFARRLNALPRQPLPIAISSSTGLSLAKMPTSW